jgi:hypothetical protein
MATTTTTAPDLTGTIRELKKARSEVEAILARIVTYYNSSTGTSGVTTAPSSGASQSLPDDMRSLKASAKKLEATYSAAYPDLFSDLSSDKLASMGCLGAITFITDDDLRSRFYKLHKKLDGRIQTLTNTMLTGSYANAGKSSTFLKAVSTFGTPYNYRYTDTKTTEVDRQNDYLAAQEVQSQYVAAKCTAISNGTAEFNDEGMMGSLSQILDSSANPLRSADDIVDDATMLVVGLMYPGSVKFCNPKMNKTSYDPADYMAAKSKVPTSTTPDTSTVLTGAVFMQSSAYQQFSKALDASYSSYQFYSAKGLVSGQAVDSWANTLATLRTTLSAAGSDSAVMKAFSALQTAKSNLDAQNAKLGSVNFQTVGGLTSR